MDGIDAEWYDIWSGCEHSLLVTWHDWITAGPRALSKYCDCCGCVKRYCNCTMCACGCGRSR